MWIQRDVAVLLFDGAHNFPLSCGVEMVSGFSKQQLEVLRHVPIRSITGHRHDSKIITTHLPATSTRRIACGMENPSNTGTACVTPSPESRTMPVVRPTPAWAIQHIIIIMMQENRIIEHDGGVPE